MYTSPASLVCAVEAVSKVPDARHNVHLVVEATVHFPHKDPHQRVRLDDGVYALRGGDDGDDEDVLLVHARLAYCRNRLLDRPPGGQHRVHQDDAAPLHVPGELRVEHDGLGRALVALDEDGAHRDLGVLAGHDVGHGGRGPQDSDDAELLVGVRHVERHIGRAVHRRLDGAGRVGEHADGLVEEHDGDLAGGVDELLPARGRVAEPPHQVHAVEGAAHDVHAVVPGDLIRHDRLLLEAGPRLHVPLGRFRG
mmetsp:Transcript_6623/g.15971  ORF Transcript_6623/g.15971 Transcript_6623/m.15971 type:complete len:252 (+) Transcript_6623:204-959(+)